MKRIKIFIKNVITLSKYDLMKQRKADIIYLTEKILSDGIYEYDIDVPFYKRLTVLPKNESVNFVTHSEKSFVRFGDGEIKLMMGLDQPFQKYDKEIVDRLFSILINGDNSVLVGINRDYFRSLLVDDIGYGRNYNRLNAYDFRMFLEANCNKNRVYFDGACTFYRFGDFSEEANIFWSKWKNFFKGKDITIICGQGILDGLEYNVFESANSIEYIYGPKANAWEKHEDIISQICSGVPKYRKLAFILGMAGKAMIPEVSKLGYIAWDIGHLAKGYNAFMTKMDATDENIANFFRPD